MRFKATDVFQYYKPSPCARRVSYIAHGIEQEQRDDPFMDLLRTLGERHEKAHVATFPGILDLSSLKDDPDEHERRTLAAIRDRMPAIYQPRFRQVVPLDGDSIELIGEPDFLLRATDGAGYVVRDSKLARNVLSSRHAGIPAQLQIYGYLYELAAGAPPAALEVHNGAGDIVRIDYRGASAVLDLLREHRRLRAADPGLYEPVGLTKCGGCGYEGRCGEEAGSTATSRSCRPSIRRRPGPSMLAASRRSTGSRRRSTTLSTGTISGRGKKEPRRKDFVDRLLRSADAFVSGKPIRLAESTLPTGPSFAMFDVEGIPPNADELDRTYLWGLKVFGDRPTPYLPALSGFGPDGDREGWFAFLDNLERLFADYGDTLPFVCWSSHEKSRIGEYLGRYGDRDGLACRLLHNLVDLLAVLRASVVLPLPSYSLKVVDQYVGHRRRLSEADGAWSMAKYIEALELGNGSASVPVVGEGLVPSPKSRESLLQEILAYNEEDLDATWAVMAWLRNRER